MKEVILLTKVLLKSSKGNTKKLNTKPVSKLFTFLAFFFVYCYLTGIVVYICYQTINSLLLFNRPEIFLNICFIGIFGFSIFQSIFTALNILFFSKDLGTLLPLPIKSYKIIMAKFNCLIFSQYIMYFVVAFPALTVYGYLLNLGVAYYLYSIFILLFFPVIPVVCVSLLLTIIMKFTKIIKNKETIQYFTAFLAILVIIFVQFAIGSGNEEVTNEQLAEKLIEVNVSLEENFSLLPNVKSAILTLNNYKNAQGLKNFIVLIIESTICYLLISFITSKVYVKTVTSLMSKGIKVKKSGSLEYKKNKISKSYVFKEIKTLIRNPIFFMQCVIPPFIFPLVFLVPSIVALKNQEYESAIIIEYISKYMNSTVGLISSIEILGVLYIFNFATITSISRDGSDAKVMKYLPIDLSRQVSYKSILGILFNIIPLIYVIAILRIELNVQILTLIYIAILGIIINVFNNFLVIIVDLKNPKTDWMSEYAVVKQNLNMFYQLIIIVTQMGLLLLGLKIENINICFITLNLIFLILTILVKNYINRNKKKLFEKIY